ncbi:MAG: TonB-dependent receptor [Thermomicrobiales bacterium]|nr:MAG: TonB-dependent receptor [Thermomicrobiales bacterium]
MTNDNTFAEMNRLQNVARNSGSLWTTYDIQTGTLQGVGGGVGLYAVGERAGDLANSFELPGYVRMDAALYYRIPNIFTRTNMVAQLNIQNLLNQQYYAQAQTRTIIDPGAPFTVIGSLKFEFN